VKAVGANLQYPAISPRGDRLVFTQSLYDTNIYRTDLTASASRRASGARFIASTLEDDHPQYSPDGQSIAFTSTHEAGPGLHSAIIQAAKPTTRHM